jgi:Bifunctional DNA primase/polymerase, N-terminal
MTMSKNDSDSALRPYGDYGPAYARAGFEPVPVVRAQKRPATKGWRTLIGLSAEQRDAVYKRYAEHNIGLLAGTILSTGRRFAIIDVDHDGFVRFVQAVLRPFVAGRFGSKGLAIFAQAADGLRSTKLKPAGAPGPLVEMFIDSGMAVVPLLCIQMAKPMSTGENRCSRQIMKNCPYLPSRRSR